MGRRLQDSGRWLSDLPEPTYDPSSSSCGAPDFLVEHLSLKNPWLRRSDWSFAVVGKGFAVDRISVAGCSSPVDLDIAEQLAVVRLKDTTSVHQTIWHGGAGSKSGSGQNCAGPESAQAVAGGIPESENHQGQ